ncbi:hypothetical protein [Arenibaculum pallidiluteum]|uniref:hypothetical protein n=1 Tax=Arenibaculum pallidiluteum TaxID=2812559 RepID=UPI001A97C90D|nr:hypothetical protein [Arenibaculum pallidiluteum]
MPSLRAPLARPLAGLLLLVLTAAAPQGHAGPAKTTAAKAAPAAATAAAAAPVAPPAATPAFDPLRAEMEDLLRRAEAGEASAAEAVARNYARGHGFIWDPPSALRWYVAAALAGSVPAAQEAGTLWKALKPMHRLRARVLLANAFGDDELARIGVGPVDRAQLKRLPWAAAARPAGFAEPPAIAAVPAPAAPSPAVTAVAPEAVPPTALASAAAPAPADVSPAVIVPAAAVAPASAAGAASEAGTPPVPRPKPSLRAAAPSGAARRPATRAIPAQLARNPD